MTRNPPQQTSLSREQMQFIDSSQPRDSRVELIVKDAEREPWASLGLSSLWQVKAKMAYKLYRYLHQSSKLLPGVEMLHAG